mgnify:CR=1 FL=1
MWSGTQSPRVSSSWNLWCRLRTSHGIVRIGVRVRRIGTVGSVGSVQSRQPGNTRTHCLIHLFYIYLLNYVVWIPVSQRRFDTRVLVVRIHTVRCRQQYKLRRSRSPQRNRGVCTSKYQSHGCYKCTFKFSPYKFYNYI